MIIQKLGSNVVTVMMLIPFFFLSAQPYHAEINLKVSNKVIEMNVSKVLKMAILDERGRGIKLSLIESIKTPSSELVQQITVFHPTVEVSSEDAVFIISLTNVIIPPHKPEVFTPLKHRSYSWNLFTGKTAWTELNLISALPGDGTVLTDFGIGGGYWGNTPRTISTSARLGIGKNLQFLTPGTDLLLGFTVKSLWRSYYEDSPSGAESRDAFWNTGYVNLRLLQHYPLKWFPGHILNVGVQLNLLTSSQTEVTYPVVLIIGLGSKL